MRLIQQTPCYSLHAYLRFKGVPYTSEFVPGTEALGKQLPVVVGYRSVHSFDAAWNCIDETFGDHMTETEKVLDEMVASYLLQSLVGVYNQWKERSGRSRTEIISTAPFGLNYYLAMKHDFKNFVTSNRNGLFVDETESDLLSNLEIIYEKLNKTIESGLKPNFTPIREVFEQLLTTPSKTQQNKNTTANSSTRGRADAVLFGHLCLAMSDPVLSLLVEKCPGLIGFWKGVGQGFFVAPLGSRDDPLAVGWNENLRGILNHPLLNTPDSPKLREILTQASRDSTSSDGNFSFLSPMKTLDEAPKPSTKPTGPDHTVLLTDPPARFVRLTFDTNNSTNNNISCGKGRKEGSGVDSEGRVEVEVSKGGLLYLSLVLGSFASYFYFTRN